MKEMQNKLFQQNSSPIEAVEESGEGLLKMNRSLKVIDTSLEKFINTIQKHKVQTEALCVEIEELKGTRESLKSDLQQMLLQAFNQEMSKLTSKFTLELRHTIESQVNESLKANVELMKKIPMEAERAASSMKTLEIQNKKRFIQWGLSLSAAVGFSCVLMASGLFYFFPQQQYVRYEMTIEQAKQMLLGKALLDNFKKLKHDDQKLISDAVEFNIKQIEAKQIK